MTPIFTLCNVFIKAEERGELQLPMANRSAYSHILFQDYDPMEAVQRLDIILFHQIIRSIINRWGGETPARQFLVQATFSSSTRPSQLEILVLPILFFFSVQSLKINYFFNLATLGHKILLNFSIALISAYWNLRIHENAAKLYFLIGHLLNWKNKDFEVTKKRGETVVAHLNYHLKTVLSLIAFSLTCSLRCGGRLADMSHHYFPFRATY